MNLRAFYLLPLLMGLPAQAGDCLEEANRMVEALGEGQVFHKGHASRLLEGEGLFYRITPDGELRIGEGSETIRFQDGEVRWSSLDSHPTKDRFASCFSHFLKPSGADFWSFVTSNIKGVASTNTLSYAITFGSAAAVSGASALPPVGMAATDLTIVPLCIGAVEASFNYVDIASTNPVARIAGRIAGRTAALGCLRQTRSIGLELTGVQKPTEKTTIADKNLHYDIVTMPVTIGLMKVAEGWMVNSMPQWAFGRCMRGKTVRLNADRFRFMEHAALGTLYLTGREFFMDNYEGIRDWGESWFE